MLDFADFAWLEQPEGNLMDAISRVWYNGSYTIAAKRIKMLELHYTMIQFLIIIIIARVGDLQCIIPISLAFLHITLYSPKKKWN